MGTNFLSKESETFEKKGWNIPVYAISILKLAFSAVSILYIFSEIQDDVKKLKSLTEKKKNEEKNV